MGTRPVYMTKNDYVIYQHVKKLSKKQLIDKVIEILDNTQDLEWTTESFHIVEAFKKIHGKKMDRDRLGCTKKWMIEGGVPEDEIVKVVDFI